MKKPIANEYLLSATSYGATFRQNFRRWAFSGFNSRLPATWNSKAATSTTAWPYVWVSIFSFFRILVPLHVRLTRVRLPCACVFSASTPKYILVPRVYNVAIISSDGEKTLCCSCGLVQYKECVRGFCVAVRALRIIYVLWFPQRPGWSTRNVAREDLWL